MDPKDFCPEAQESAERDRVLPRGPDNLSAADPTGRYKSQLRASADWWASVGPTAKFLEHEELEEDMAIPAPKLPVV